MLREKKIVFIRTYFAKSFACIQKKFALLLIVLVSIGPFSQLYAQGVMVIKHPGDVVNPFGHISLLVILKGERIPSTNSYSARAVKIDYNEFGVNYKVLPNEYTLNSQGRLEAGNFENYLVKENVFYGKSQSQAGSWASFAWIDQPNVVGEAMLSRGQQLVLNAKNGQLNFDLLNRNCAVIALDILKQSPTLDLSLNARSLFNIGFRPQELFDQLSALNYRTGLANAGRKVFAGYPESAPNQPFIMFKSRIVPNQGTYYVDYDSINFDPKYDAYPLGNYTNRYDDYNRILPSTDFKIKSQKDGNVTTVESPSYISNYTFEIKDAKENVINLYTLKGGQDFTFSIPSNAVKFDFTVPTFTLNTYGGTESLFGTRTVSSWTVSNLTKSVVFNNATSSLLSSSFNTVNPGGVDFRTVDLASLKIDPTTGMLDFIFQSHDGIVYPGESSTSPENPAPKAGYNAGYLKKVFLQTLAIPNQNQYVSLNNGLQVDPVFAKTDMARNFLEADVELKHDVMKWLVDRNGTSPSFGQAWVDFLHARSSWEEIVKIGQVPLINLGVRVNIKPYLSSVNASENKGNTLFLEDARFYIERTVFKYELSPDITTLGLSKAAVDDINAALEQFRTNEIDKRLNEAIPLTEDKINNAVEGSPYYYLRIELSTIIAAQWYKEQLKNKSILNAQYEYLIDANDLLGIETDVPFNTAFWQSKADELLGNGDLVIDGETYSKIYTFTGGVTIGNTVTENKFSDLLNYDQQQIIDNLSDQAYVLQNGRYYLNGTSNSVDLPELTSGGFWISKDGEEVEVPQLGETYKVNVLIYNSGRTPTSRFDIQVAETGQSDDGTYSYQEDKYSLISGIYLNPGEKYVYSFDWSPSFQKGYKFEVLINKANVYGFNTEISREYNFSDNYASYYTQVMGELSIEQDYDNEDARISSNNHKSISLKESNSFELAYPNPFKDKINISYQLSTPGNVAITLYNLSSGEKVFEKQYNVKEIKGKQQFEEVLDLPGLSTGMYYLKVETSEGVSVQKLLNY